jgi:CheY-like chemotaxis protein
VQAQIAAWLAPLKLESRALVVEDAKAARRNLNGLLECEEVVVGHCTDWGEAVELVAGDPRLGRA